VRLQAELSHQYLYLLSGHSVLPPLLSQCRTVLCVYRWSPGAERPGKGFSHFSLGGIRPRALDGGVHDVLPALAGVDERVQGILNLFVVSLLAQSRELGNHLLLHVFPELARFDRREVNIFRGVDITAHHLDLALLDHLVLALDVACNLAVQPVVVNDLNEASHPLNLIELFKNPPLGLIGQRLNVEGSGERIDNLRDLRLRLDDLLCADRRQECPLGGNRKSLVVRVNVQGLRPAEHRREGVVRCADDIVERFLPGQRDSRGLNVESILLMALYEQLPYPMRQ